MNYCWACQSRRIETTREEVNKETREKHRCLDCNYTMNSSWSKEAREGVAE